jgi:hypothetical protein
MLCTLTIVMSWHMKRRPECEPEAVRTGGVKPCEW